MAGFTKRLQIAEYLLQGDAVYFLKRGSLCRSAKGENPDKKEKDLEAGR